jgi:hypothetical protein
MVRMRSPVQSREMAPTTLYGELVYPLKAGGKTRQVFFAHIVTCYCSNMYSYTLTFIAATTYSIVVETIIVMLLIRFVLKSIQIPPRTIIGTCFIATFATIPYVWYVFPILWYHSIFVSILFSEIFAVFIETTIYTMMLKITLRQAFILAFLANIVSYFSGSFLNFSLIFF